MKYIFVRVAEGDELTTSWLLLSDDDAEAFITDKDEWLKSYDPNGYIVYNSTEFTTDQLKNGTISSDLVGQMFTALLKLDKVDTPIVSDLLITIFKLGHKTGESYANYKKLPDSHESQYGRARRRKMMLEGP